MSSSLPSVLQDSDWLLAHSCATLLIGIYWWTFSAPFHESSFLHRWSVLVFLIRFSPDCSHECSRCGFASVGCCDDLLSLALDGIGVFICVTSDVVLIASASALSRSTGMRLWSPLKLGALSQLHWVLWCISMLCHSVVRAHCAFILTQVWEFSVVYWVHLYQFKLWRWFVLHLTLDWAAMSLVNFWFGALKSLEVASK